MKIVQVIGYFQTELGYPEAFLAKELARLGHDVCIITSDRYKTFFYSGSKSALVGRTTNPGFYIEEGIKVWRLKSLFELHLQLWMRGLERKILEIKPDLVIMHDICTFSALRIARLKNHTLGFKLVYDEHMTEDNSRSPLRVLYPLFKLLFSSTIRKSADKLVAILPETRTLMHKKFGLPLDRISIIPLGADDIRFRCEASARKAIRKELSIADNDVLFIYTGKIVPVKKLPTLIKAMAILASTHQEAKLLVLGNGPDEYMDDLKSQVQNIGLEDRILWKEAVPNDHLFQYYSAADVAVWPCGATISMREAMSCRLPIIIGQNSKVLELLE
ncbi:MAG: glycosyltransferase family 4 protein, partial [Pseudomonadota bacterium]